MCSYGTVNERNVTECNHIYYKSTRSVSQGMGLMKTLKNQPISSKIIFHLMFWEQRIIVSSLDSSRNSYHFSVYNVNSYSIINIGCFLSILMSFGKESFSIFSHKRLSY